MRHEFNEKEFVHLTGNRDPFYCHWTGVEISSRCLKKLTEVQVAQVFECIENYVTSLDPQDAFNRRRAFDIYPQAVIDMTECFYWFSNKFTTSPQPPIQEYMTKEAPKAICSMYLAAIQDLEAWNGRRRFRIEVENNASNTSFERMGVREYSRFCEYSEENSVKVFHYSPNKTVD